MTRTGANLVVHMDLPKTGTTVLQDHVSGNGKEKRDLLAT